MKLQNKVFIAIGAILILVMICSMIVVSIILYSQNREASSRVLKDAHNVLHSRLEELGASLQKDTIQMATSNDMGGKMKYLVENSGYFKFRLMRPVYLDICKSIYNISITAKIWKVFLYNDRGLLTAFVINDEAESYIGYIHDNDMIEVAHIQSNEKLTSDSWKQVSTLPEVRSVLEEQIPGIETFHFESINHSFCQVSYVPIVEKAYNQETNTMEPRQFGLISAIQKIDKAAITNIGQMNEVFINIFLEDGLSIGTLSKYKSLDLETLKVLDEKTKPEDHSLLMNDMTIDEAGYFEGLLPIYSGPKRIAVISFLQSKKLIRDNTLQIIKLLGLVFLVSFVLTIPLAGFAIHRFIQPIQAVAEAARSISSGDLDRQVPVIGGQEIGDLGRSFNDMTMQLKHIMDELKDEIDERKKTEQSLQKIKDGLEIAVQERTLELASANQKLREEIIERNEAEKENRKLEEQLQRAQRMEALGTLAGGVAHDLNNILSGIVTYPDLLLLDLPEDSPFREAILTIKKSGEKASLIVQDLLTLARRGVMNIEVINLNDIIMDYLKSPEYKKLESSHPGIEIEVNLAKDLLNIMGSQVHLSKSLMNLMLNAVEALPGRGKISISTTNQYIDRPIKGYEKVSEGDYTAITVRDDGIGISEKDIEKIFEPFYSKKILGRSGTGLGMAVVWGTIKDHNGYIDIKSKEGEGTTITIYFPITRKPVSKEKIQLPIEELMGKGETVLIVDDVEEQRTIASNILAKLGYEVKAVSSGEEAVEYLRKNKVALILLDMIMEPGIDGLETYKEIIELHPRQKAIIASGYSETERIKEVQRLGAGQYVKKPYTLEKMGIAIRAELDANNNKHSKDANLAIFN